MSYQVLARKWRPRRFSELVGQEHVVRALSHALASGRMHHAYLFTGTRGVGKTTIARILAKSLNCERGTSAEPCGECAVCLAVDAGRFVDLLEIDAASNTGVDDVREVIENAQYAPTRGRYKVYLIDEVHMLSKNAFNALLKTLEEPPPHAMFLLATTDPQKLPVTVLSRCLKFNLKRLLPEQIQGQMQHILDAEGIACEADALVVLARAADGSLRDGLSLLDQAIAYGGGAVRAADVRAMLGSLDSAEVLGLARALAAGDGAALLAEAQRIVAFAPDFGKVLDDLAALWHRVQLRQLVPGYAAVDEADGVALDALAARLSAEEVQLDYQLALSGRRDLPLAPDEAMGFEMALLRMLAFRPQREDDSARAALPPAARPAPLTAPAIADAPADPAPAPAPRAGATRSAGIDLASAGLPDWAELIERAELRGPLGEMARRAALQSRDGHTLVLAMAHHDLVLASPAMLTQLESKLEAALGERPRLRCVGVDQPDSPAARAAALRGSEQTAAISALQADPVIVELQQTLGARLLPESIRPVEQNR
ncbi:DNA polymerase III subunit gamma/tau [Metallibacterium sp.]|uniref:DNA polymerase III subunit gamma/tau n=1 Tax=Metallibacterium sp. TaxID=2940281 RepID=UPI00262FB209|nr:DNA polymerase III subunit gamma/tau [Metallibacterium sp.]